MTHFSHDYEQGIKHERERIIKLLEGLNCLANGIEHDCGNDLAGYTPNDLTALIKDTSKMITSELLPDGTIHIEEVKGKQKVIHTHEIEVFGSPCDCGTRHEYCGECDWVEPCEPVGEQK